jgi:ribosomal protein L7Ae-like RNA K-turn-binding protein
LRADVKVAPDLPATVERLMARSLLDALSIARKAQQLVTGHAKTEAAAEQGAAVAVVQASDAGPEGVRQIMAAIRRGSPADAANIVVIRAFTSAQLDLAFARPNVVHAALLAGRASDTVIARWRSLARFRSADPDGAREIQPKQEAPGSVTE